MIDFKKLMQRTPEERAEADAECARQEAEYVRSLEALISTRTEQVNALALISERMGDFDKGFIRSMAYRAETFDMLGRLGGGLSTLSDKQCVHFARLVALLPKPAVPAPDALADALADPEVISAADGKQDDPGVERAHTAPRA